MRNAPIYALLDVAQLHSHRLTLSQYLEGLRAFDVPILQYRNKEPLSLQQMQEDLLTIKKMYKGKVIVNDHLELIGYTDGLHIGQEDLLNIGNDKSVAIKKLREKLNDKILGLSTHNKDEVLEANRFTLDYIGLGAYRSTETKKEARVAGETLLEIATLSKHPVALIGGVRIDDRFDQDVIAYRVIGSDLMSRIANKSGVESSA